MAGTCIKMADRANTRFLEFVCDSTSDIQNLPTTNNAGVGDFKYFKSAPIGSTCIVGNEGGDILVYMLFSFGWKQL